MYFVVHARFLKKFTFAVSSRDELHVILAFKSIALVLTEEMQVQILAGKGME